jgi:hypothetical protein
MLGIKTARSEPPKQIRLVGAKINAAGVVEHITDLDAATEQRLAGGDDIGDDEVQTLGRSGRCLSNFCGRR